MMLRALRTIGFILAILVTVWLTRATLSRNLPDLHAWHHPVLQSEFRASDYPNGIQFSEYQALEKRLVNEIDEAINPSLKPDDKVVTNRFNPSSPAHRSAWPQDWNLSFELTPTNPKGAIILLHGASDSPYSFRTLAKHYFDAGLYVLAIRLPGNGTVPGELTKVSVDDWTSLIPMGLRAARKQVGSEQPIYLGGYSTGATLALNYSLKSLEDRSLLPVDQLIFFSPAVDLSSAAGLAKWDTLFSRIPLFEKFAWATVWPEPDPFKYSSFPKQAGHLVFSIASDNQKRIERLNGKPVWSDFPPLLTFQSIVDATISVSAILDLHQALPSDKSQLVLFDVNRHSNAVPFLRRNGNDLVQRIKETPFAHVDVTLVGNANSNSNTVIATRQCNGRSNCSEHIQLTAQWPTGVVSLSHIAMPFPPDDPVYGQGKQQGTNGYNLGGTNSKGERGVLVIPAEDLNRLRYNPFYDYMLNRALTFCTAC